MRSALCILTSIREAGGMGKSFDQLTNYSPNRQCSEDVHTNAVMSFISNER